MREHENINARYIQYMYTFVYKWCSLFSHSTVYVRSLKDATLKKKDIGDKFMSEKKLCKQKYHYHSDSKGEHDETYIFLNL